MKSFNLIHLVFLSAFGILSSCHKASLHQGFLGISSKEESEKSEEDKKNEEDDLKNEEDEEKRKIPEKDRIVVSGAEWEAAKDESRVCKAELAAVNSQTKLMEDAAYARGEKSCKERDSTTKEEITRKVFTEVEGILDEIKNQLLRYRLSYVIVNGECLAKKTDGRSESYVLKDDTCLNIVNKKVGNDGEISGILGAVSPEAIKEGILSLDCDIGKASFKFISKKCDYAVGTGAGVGKFDPKK